MGTGRARRIAVVGAGWAGLAAAVRATQAGATVTLVDMAPAAGGRARSVPRPGAVLDNGQHILIGAYQRTLDLMRSVGVDPQAVLLRRPLALIDGRGAGLRLPPGAPLPALARGVLGHRGWSWRDRLSLLAHAAGWMAGGFRCVPDRPVAHWAAGLPAAVRETLIEPLCVAALNTSAAEASAAVFLRVLRDALFSGAGSADLLLPRRPLGELLPKPALDWLVRHGATVQLGRRVGRLVRTGTLWQLDDDPHPQDHVVLACTAREAARLAGPIAPAWAADAADFRHEPIITAWVEAPRIRAPYPMLALAGAPAQFAFDLGALDPSRAGTLTLVASGARAWVEAPDGAFEQALERQLQDQLGEVLPEGWTLRATMTERRATFRCTPGLRRPRQAVAPGLSAAGDYLEGPYPATLEGAVRSGESAAAAATATAG